MGANPMQRMKRNSILIGLIVGLVIGLVLCGVVYLFLTSSSSTIPVNSEEAITVYALNKDIKSGNKITKSDISPKVMNKSDVPVNVTDIKEDTEVSAKIDLLKGTILTKSMINSTSEEITADLREKEYNMIILPSQLAVGSFIDIRLQLPNGGDYIVISKKKVMKCDSSTIWLNMNEEEILIMSNAIIEYYIMPGSKLYATIYTEPGIQAASLPTYCPNSEVANLIMQNKNITSQVQDGTGRFTEALKNIRNSSINTEISEYSDSAIANIEENVKKEIKSLQESREAYFGSLNSAY